ncbi:MAG TPA: ribosomal protein S18-alanine N-acetyltransferase [Desulfobacteria bacterium]|nr:ribosomal protein S18-alanine N-acetyltransferase [Desulfobacteria bacterium]
MLEEYSIIPMSLRHLDEVLEIEKQSFPTPWSRYAFNCELNDNEFAHYFCVTHQNKVVGYMGVWVIIDEGHITNVAIHQDYRNRGLGELLMRTVASRCLALGVERMTLEVRTSNLIAQSLYKRLGFTSAGIRKGYYTDTQEDAIIMWKEIG